MTTGFATLAAGHPLVHVNAALNTLATVLLIAAFVLAKQRRFAAHGKTMIAALAASAAFLTTYLIYHAIAGSVPFTQEGAVRYVYYSILLTHVVLAFTVPFLAIAAAWFGAGALGWRNPASATAAAQGINPREAARLRHLQIVRWAFPIWLYVSVTGVIVYAMLYHIWPSSAA